MPTSFKKKELEQKKEKKRKDKQQRKEERKADGSRSFDDMIAYVDEYGAITNTPPDPYKKTKVDLYSIEVSTPKMDEITVFNGRVEYFNPEKGYGFIKKLSGVEKYFFHVSNAQANIAEGKMVTFELERGERGMNAVNVSITK